MTFPGVNLLVTVIFLLCLAATVAGALIAILARRIMRSVCGLALCALGLAGLFYFLNSPFLALMEILIYIGAVCVTMLFAIMLAEPDEPKPDALPSSSPLWALLALLVSGAAFLGLGWLASHGLWAPPAARANDGSIEAIGVALLSTHSFAFELISLVILAAILGALALARAGRSKT